jgi:DNA polymerase I-like protein with 3'-5' exonuclease and polymerase domains
MVKILTHETDIDSLSKKEVDWLYNGLDCCITHQLAEVLVPEAKKKAPLAYNFEMAMLPVVMSMMQRGLRVDEDAVHELMHDLFAKRQKYMGFLDECSEAVWDRKVNPQSDAQLKELLYDVLGIEPVKKREGPRWKITTNREALEKIEAGSAKGRPFAALVLAIRDIDKQTQVLNADRDNDGRIRTSFNIGGTETWRFSSSQSPIYSGINFQNVTERLRHCFVADPGYKYFYADLEQAESRVVAYLSADGNYIHACESGDLHTSVVRMVWPDFGWTGNADEDRAIADQPYFGQFSYRDVCKRAGHGTNYGLRPTSLARHLKIKVREAARFQLQYYGGNVPYHSLEGWHKQDRAGGYDKFIEEGVVIGAAPVNGAKDHRIVEVQGAFPGIRRWHDEVAAQLEEYGKLTNPFGFTRKFWGRLTDAATLREAIAFLPQSTVGILTNIGLYRIHYELKEVQLLANVHDAALGQIPIDRVDELAPKVVECMVNPLEVNGHRMIIPSSIEIGDNWGHADEINVNGMKEWSSA